MNSSEPEAQKEKEQSCPFCGTDQKRSLTLHGITPPRYTIQVGRAPHTCPLQSAGYYVLDDNSLFLNPDTQLKLGNP